MPRINKFHSEFKEWSARDNRDETPDKILFRLDNEDLSIRRKEKPTRIRKPKITKSKSAHHCKKVGKIMVLKYS